MKGNVYYNWPKGWCEETLRLADDTDFGNDPFDVAIIGAGVVGCALAWHLSHYQLRVLLVDKNHDVGEATSKANSAIIHTGFDAAPGTLESRLVTKASRMWPAVAEAMKIPFRQTAAMVLAMTDDEKELLPKLLEKSHQNGVEDVRLLAADQVRELEPGVSEQVKGALYVDRESIIDPFASCYALAEVAVINGVDLVLGLPVESVTAAGDGIKTLNCSGNRRFNSRYVVNAAGLGSTTLSSSYGALPLDINPRRGQFLIYDKTTGSRVNRILLPVPNPITKGILVAPTIFGNVIVGPTAEDLPFDPASVPETTSEGIESIRSGAAILFPGINQEPAIGTYAGLRCNCTQGQYQIAFNDGIEGIVTLTGIRSTGLTVSIALAEYIREGLENECGLVCQPDDSAVSSRAETSRPGWSQPRPFEDEQRLTENRDYADMICFCEQISRQEVIDAIRSPLSPRTIDAVRRRTRATTGRCQGFNCLINIARLISENSGTNLERITKKGPGSELIYKPVAE